MERVAVDQVWTPVQHTALWLGAWVTGRVSYDHLLDALDAVGGLHRVELVDAVVPEVVDLDAPIDRAGLLRLVRAVTDGGAWARDAEPPVRLVLSGPGEAPMLPAGTELYDDASRAGAAIVLADAAPGWHHVLVPDHSRGRGVTWRWWSVEGHLPEPAHLSPGAADLLLADATRAAAADIAASGPAARLGVTAPDPRLMVGTLTDHFDMAELPDELPRRAGGLLARADRLAAILTVARGEDPGAGAVHDPHLIPLWRDIRAARTAAVDHAIREWAADYAEG
ncbi:hypothetical protein [uncultured Corynebacterium sp.]|uniref:hypothetical protein n=1 Tax=uncultured Corynebacterium sp. TaxID=159447 RepID=UPI0025D9AAD6|nr:hypothetical protein [uncultured Corynebacterium sp.]